MSNFVILEIVQYHERSLSIKTGLGEGNKSITDVKVDVSRGSLRAKLPMHSLGA